MEYDYVFPSPFLSQASSSAFDLSSLYDAIMIPPDSPFFGESSGGGGENLPPFEAAAFPQPQILLDRRHHQDLVARQSAVLGNLREMAKQAQALRQENVNLKMANLDLNRRLALLLKASPDYASVHGGPPEFGVRRKSGPVGDQDSAGEGQPWEDLTAAAAALSSSCDRRTRESPIGITLPKSISVRSRGYVKSAQAAQKVHVKGGKKEEGPPLELEVYNQGMFKTELCNKWQETGGCPYGGRCQYAHGLDELRPVLRHPRYKTEVCRMVLNGGPCPYGHRCHFRHSLSRHEKHFRSLLNPS
ncbi:unnamed protein product [Cuscuta campestris]|uniref:C3H1-type domain-containing protein n=1 Tax=Cuscuta campestris TaxID=132261 RepID=A0A484LP45_9ASTE|nr:unnamed protein product [Cuscuta campestris]